MKKISTYFLIFAVALGFGACQDKDIEVADMIIATPNAESVTGQLNGYDYTLSWPQPAAGQTMTVAIYRAGSMIQSFQAYPSNSLTLKNVETNDPYEFVMKLTDGTNQSNGIVIPYTREGATKIKGLSMAQVENADGTNDAVISWAPCADADNIELTVSNGTKTETVTVAGNTTSYIVKGVSYGDTWTVSAVTMNSKGRAIPDSTSLLIGKLAMGFLSAYATEEDLLKNGDDDEASAWLWMKANYPQADYIYFKDITSAKSIERYRMLFWLRDVETGKADDVWAVPTVAEAAAPFVGEWVKNGGNLLLWSHAVPYIGYIGRLELSKMQSVGCDMGCSQGGYNGDTWKMGASINTGSFSKDNTTHPIFRGLTVEYSGDGISLLAFKGPGWTEDHNFCLSGLPAALTGLDNKSEDCYKSLTQEYGIYPLATWDFMAKEITQLNVWEAKPATQTDYKGTVVCIGNGGCEFSMKNNDGTPDVSATPKNNSYQSNVLKLAQNCVEYLMSI